MPKEIHPYISKYFDNKRLYKYLIIGTFPPNREVREGTKSLTDFFYGNKGSLWKILGKIYNEFDFEKGSRNKLIEQMQSWQIKYEVGITDTLVSVSRKELKSSDDSDFILDYDDYNHELKKYILTNNKFIEKIYFTSSKECNSALETFKIIMGNDINTIKEKLITTLPSPSGSSNTAWFNVNNDETLGLHQDLHNYVVSEKKEYIEYFKNRWELKKEKKATKSNIDIPKCPKGLLLDFKVWSYKNVFPVKK